MAGRVATKPGQTIGPDIAISIDDPASGYVSRGALKLVAALDAFGLDPGGRICLDLGASTGGFTQVLLKRGAAHVHAVDVGRDQLDISLHDHPRLTRHDGLNARDLDPSAFPDAPNVLVADLSFISLRTALPRPLECLSPEPSWLAVLVKPQFEVGRAHIGKGGLVRDPDVARRSVEDVADWLAELGWACADPITSPVKGGDGNTEYLLGARRDR